MCQYLWNSLFFSPGEVSGVEWGLWLASRVPSLRVTTTASPEPGTHPWKYSCTARGSLGPRTESSCRHDAQEGIEAKKKTENITNILRRYLSRTIIPRRCSSLDHTDEPSVTRSLSWRGLPAQHGVEHHSEAPNINGLALVLLAFYDFGCHIAWGTFTRRQRKERRAKSP